MCSDNFEKCGKSMIEFDEYKVKLNNIRPKLDALADSLGIEAAKEEIDRIISQLASLKIFPRKYLDEIAKGDVVKTFNESVENLLRINPGMREGMLRYMIDIVMSDQLIAKEEIELLYNFGENVGLSKIEVANAIAEAIQQNYVPSLESIV